MGTSNKLIAQTHTIEEFISRKYEDELTYRNLSIVEYIGNVELIDRNLFSDYLPEIERTCISYPFTTEEYRLYKYAPDLLSYDLYRTTQLDFVILMLNDMIDPKEFNIKVVKLPNAAVLMEALGSILSVNSGFIEQNRADNNLTY